MDIYEALSPRQISVIGSSRPSLPSDGANSHSYWVRDRNRTDGRNREDFIAVRASLLRPR